MSKLISDTAWSVLTIWAEARGEPYDGKVAVGEVIRNRQAIGNRPAGVVVLQPLQFSCWNVHDANRVRLPTLDDVDPVVHECVRAWNESADHALADGATLYYSTTIDPPGWASRARFVVEIGRHRFYSEV